MLWAIGFALVVAIATGGRLAIGFLVPIALLAMFDAVLSNRELSTRRLQLRPVSRLVNSPQSVEVWAHADPGRASLLISDMVFTPAETWTASAVIPAEGGGVKIRLASGQPAARQHLRAKVSTSRFGLVSVHRWEVHPTADIVHRSPGGRPHTVKISADADLARLRPYVAGDRMSRVSWPTTARSGVLHVRDEAVGGERVPVVIDLGELPEEIHLDDFTLQLTAVLQLAADALASLIADGFIVELICRQAAPSVFANEIEMAKADPTTPHRPELPIPTEVITVELADQSRIGEFLSLVEVGEPVPRPAWAHLIIDNEGLRVEP